MTGERQPTLPGAIDELAAQLEGVRTRDTGTAIEYALDGRVFAAREGERVAFRLFPEIVDAALRTPDTARSSRGTDWVSLAPATVDGFAIDRARAWFESAWRLAGAGSEARSQQD